jgi:hypothetical protein
VLPRADGDGCEATGRAQAQACRSSSGVERLIPNETLGSEKTD